MTRPRKCRMVGFIPDNQCFHPQLSSCGEVVLTIEETEALRLADFLEMEQDKAAESMNVSRGTFQRIVNLARKKTADALVNGKTIRIEGGHFKLSAGKPCCRKSNGTCMHKSCEKFEACEENKA